MRDSILCLTLSGKSLRKVALSLLADLDATVRSFDSRRGLKHAQVSGLCVEVSF